MRGRTARRRLRFSDRICGVDRIVCSQLEHDVRKMQIAMAAAHEASDGRALQAGADALGHLVRCLREPLDFFSLDMIAGPQAIAVAIDQARDGGNPCLAVGGAPPHGTPRSRRRRPRQGWHPAGRLRQMVQRPAFVEARHVDGILDRPAASVDLHRSVWLFGDRDDAVIDLRRRGRLILISSSHAALRFSSVE